VLWLVGHCYFACTKTEHAKIPVLCQLNIILKSVLINAITDCVMFNIILESVLINAISEKSCAMRLKKNCNKFSC